MKRVFPPFFLMALLPVCLLAESDKPKAPVDQNLTLNIKRAAAAIMKAQSSTVLSDDLRLHLSKDLDKPIAIGGKKMSVDIAENGSAWEAYESTDQMRLVDRFVQSDKAPLLVTVTICYMKADERLLYLETRSEPVTLSDTPAGNKLKL